MAEKNGSRVARPVFVFVWLRIEPDGLRPLIDWITHYQKFWPGRMLKLETLLGGMDDE